MSGPALGIAAHFLLLSLLAVGGINTVIPEIHRLVVEQYGLMSDPQFADLFAISRASPGPNMLIVSLIGWKAARLPGALLATGAICAPSTLLTYLVSGLWRRFRDAPWRRAIEGGLVPVTVGLVLASGYVLTRAAGQSLAGLAVTAVTVLAVIGSRINPLWLLGGAALLGAFGLI